MRLQKLFYIFLCTIALIGCGGSQYKKRQTALTHYKQASLEAKDFQDKRDYSALHKALDNIDKSLAAQETANALALKGTILLQLKHLDESIAIFEKIANNKSTSKAKRADAQNNLATALYQHGDTKRATNLWHQLAGNAHYISPEVAHYNLGYAMLNEACKAQRTGTVAERTNCLQQAAQYFTNAIATSREFVDAHFYLANTLLALNQPEPAREHLLTILTINPDHAPAQKMLNYIAQLAQRT